MTAPTLSNQTSRHNTLAAAYVVANVASGTAIGAVQISVPIYALHLDASIVEIGIIRSVAGLGTLLLVIPAGLLVDHYGPRGVFVLGSLFAAVTTALLGLVMTPVSLAVVMGLSGVFHALKITALNASFFNDLGVIGIARAGWFKGSMAIGLAFLGPLLSGVMVSRVPFSVQFAVLALLTLLPLAFALAAMNARPRKILQHGLVSGLSVQVAQLKTVLADRRMYFLLTTEGLSTALFAVFSTFIAVISAQRFGLPPAAASLLMSLEGALFIATLFFASPLSRKLGTRRLFATSAAVIVTGLVALAAAASVPLLVAGVVLLGFGLGLTNLFVSDQIGRMDGEKGKIVGVFTTAIGIGLSVGPLVGGVVGELFGPDAIFLAFVPLFALLGAVPASVPHRSPAPLRIDKPSTAI